MGLIANNNVPGINFPCWEQMPAFMPANSAAGSCMCSDNKRYIYYLISTSSFWRIDTWSGVCEKLSNPGSGGVGAGTCMCYSPEIAEEGALFVLLASGTTIVFYQYFIQSDVWLPLSSSGLPSNFGTCGSIFYPSAYYFNNNLENFHPAITTKVKLTTNIPKNFCDVVNIEPIISNIPGGTILNFGNNDNPKYVKLIDDLAIGATSMKCYAYSDITTNDISYYYDHLYLIGNNSTQMYRYQISTNTWYTTAVAGPNLLLPTAAAAGSYISINKAVIYQNNIHIICIIGGTKNIVILDITNSAGIATATKELSKTIETFTLGSQYCIKMKDNIIEKFVVAPSNSRKYSYMDINSGSDFNNKYSLAYQDIMSEGTAIAGNRTCILNQNGIDYLYTVLNTSNYMLRCPILW